MFIYNIKQMDVLQEIQSQRASLLDVDVLETPAPSTLHPMDITDRLSSTSNTCGGQERPSPDEAVIMARGRRLVPIKNPENSNL